jgi:anti-sigma-K factor RskA
MRAVHILNGPIDLAMLGVVAVTVEPAAGSPAPTTQPIIAAPVGT